MVSQSSFLFFLHNKQKKVERKEIAIIFVVTKYVDQNKRIII